MSRAWPPLRKSQYENMAAELQQTCLQLSKEYAHRGVNVRFVSAGNPSGRTQTDGYGHDGYGHGCAAPSYAQVDIEVL